MNTVHLSGILFKPAKQEKLYLNILSSISAYNNFFAHGWIQNNTQHIYKTNESVAREIYQNFVTTMFLRLNLDYILKLDLTWNDEKRTKYLV